MKSNPRSRKLWLAILLVFAGSACSTSHHKNEGIATGKGLETLVVLGTNDIHGALLPADLKTREPDGVKPIEYQAGGAAYISSEVKALREEFGDHLLWLDGGDEFQGSIESNTFQGAPLVQFFNEAGLKAAAIGNHEFDYGAEKSSDGNVVNPDNLLGALEARIREAHYPYLAANIVDRSTGKLPFPNTQKSALFQAGKLKVGVIGLSTLDTPTTTRAENIRSLEFQNLKDATLREAKTLRDQGAQIVLITAHAGLECGRGHTSNGLRFRKITDPQGDCGENDEMVRLLNLLPFGTVDGVVSGHTHQIVHHWVAGVPVIQGGAFGRYFNLIYLTYNWNTGKLETDRTRIEGPIPVCPKIFQNQNDCYGDAPAPKGGRGSLVPMVLHGHEISADPALNPILEPVIARTGEIKKRVLGNAARPLEHFRHKESPLGNLVADAIREEVGADVAIMNGGGIRAPIESGPITFGAVFKTLPFDNAISLLTVTGKQLKLLLRVAESGSRGVFPVSGVKLRLIDPEYEAPSEDLNHDGKIESWEFNRLIDARMSDGEPIHDGAKYKVATIDFLVTGGDDMAWPISQLAPNQIQLNAGGVMRDAVVKRILKLATINDENHPLVDAMNPRIRFEKVKKARKFRRRRKHSHRH